MWTCHRCRNWIYYVRNWHELSPELQGPRATQPAGTYDAVRAARICEGAFYSQEQPKCGQHFTSWELCDSVPQLSSIQSESTIKRELVDQIEEENSHPNIESEEGNENSSDFKVSLLPSISAFPSSSYVTLPLKRLLFLLRKFASALRAHNNFIWGVCDEYEQKWFHLIPRLRRQFRLLPHRSSLNVFRHYITDFVWAHKKCSLSISRRVLENPEEEPEWEKEELV